MTTTHTEPLPAHIVPPRQHLRAVGPHDTPAAADALLRSLPPGSTWAPAPGHHVPAAPGRPPMVGYLVLVPTDQVPEPQAHTQAVLEPEPGRGVRIDADRRTAHVEGSPLDLTYLEFELLAHLVGHPHRVHTRDHLVNTVWGYGHIGDGRTVDVHIARLRRKLGSAHRGSIVTVRRVGYKYAPPSGG